MNFEKPQINENIEKSELSEKDKAVAEQLQDRLEKIKNFEPSSNIYDDFNEIIKLTHRDNLYKEVDDNTSRQEVLVGLVAMKTAWDEILSDPGIIDQNNLAKKLFYIDVPLQEIETVNRVINFYLKTLNFNGQKNERGTDFEKFSEKFN